MARDDSCVQVLFFFLSLMMEENNAAIRIESRISVNGFEISAEHYCITEPERPVYRTLSEGNLFDQHVDILPVTAATLEP